MEHNLKVHTYWNLGAKIGKTVYSLAIRAVG